MFENKTSDIHSSHCILLYFWISDSWFCRAEYSTRLRNLKPVRLGWFGWL